jgi:hypothetical protein
MAENARRRKGRRKILIRNSDKKRGEESEE